MPPPDSGTPAGTPARAWPPATWPRGPSATWSSAATRSSPGCPGWGVRRATGSPSRCGSWAPAGSTRSTASPIATSGSVAASRRWPRWPTGSPGAEPGSAAPPLVGGLDDELQLGPLLIDRQAVALLGRGEAALGRQAQLVGVDELRRGLDATLEQILVLQLGTLGGDQTEHHVLALRDEAQPLERAGALVVELQEVAVDVEVAEQCLGDEVVAPFGRPHRLVVSAAQVSGDDQIVRLAGQSPVDGGDVLLMQGVRVAAAPL